MGGGRGLFVPDCFDKGVGRHDLAGVHQEAGQHGALAGTAEDEVGALVSYLETTQNSETHLDQGTPSFYPAPVGRHLDRSAPWGAGNSANRFKG